MTDQILIVRIRANALADFDGRRFASLRHSCTTSDSLALGQ